MPQRKSKREFYSKGSEKQKTPDIVMDLRRADSKEISKWSQEQKDDAKEFLEEAISTFHRFINEITDSM